MSKEKALNKMLEEKNQLHSKSIDKIHTYLSEQDDEKLFEAILNEKKSIKKSLDYCHEKANKLASGNNYLVVDDEEVYEWVKEYYFSEDEEEIEEDVDNESDVSEFTEIIKPKPKPKSKKNKDDNQMSMFEL